MKKSVLNIVLVSLVMLFSVSATSVYAESSPKFLYNTYMENEKVVSKEICKHVEASTYKRHLRYEYTYTDQGMPASCKASRWNTETNTWDNWHIITYDYDEILSAVTLNYALWNSEANTYDAPKEKAVYQYSADSNLLHYAQYEKKSSVHWEIKTEIGVSDSFVSQLSR